MIEFKVSAPGTLNLFGENVTCEDHNGVMASINRRTTVIFNELPVDTSVIILEFSQFNMNYAIHLEEFRNFYKRFIFDDTLSEQILEFISTVFFWQNECHKKIGHTLYYLLAHVTYMENIEIENVKPFQVCLYTELPNLNFGGFASLAVCFTTCFLHWSHLRSDAQHSLTDDDRAKISMYSKSCDKIVTDCMFISYVTVSTYGSLLRYHCKDSSQNDVLDNMPKMRVLMIVSTVDKDLDEEDVAKMKKYWKNCDPRMANSILDNITDISDTAFSVFKEICDMDKEAPTYKQDVSAQEKTLLPLIRMQQRLNNIFINFHYKMHLICEIAQRYELHGKCADFVRGRNTYIWCLPGIDTSSMENDFRSNGFDVKPIHLNCDGVRIE